MSRSHRGETWSPATSLQAPELQAKLSTTAASPAAGSTTPTSQTRFLRGMSSQGPFKNWTVVCHLSISTEAWTLEGLFVFLHVTKCTFSPPRSHFSVSLKTHSSFGLIFYVSDAQEDDFMALFLAHGKLVYTFNVADQRVKIKSPEKYNDGVWHDVSALQLCVRPLEAKYSNSRDTLSLLSCPRLFLSETGVWAG